MVQVRDANLQGKSSVYSILKLNDDSDLISTYASSQIKDGNDGDCYEQVCTYWSLFEVTFVYMFFEIFNYYILQYL